MKEIDYYTKERADSLEKAGKTVSWKKKPWTLRYKVWSGLKNWKNAMIMFFQGFVVITFMILIPTGIVFGLFGLSYLLDVTRMLIIGQPINPFELDLTTLFAGVFTGSGISFIWNLWIFKKMKMFKEKKKDE